MKNLKYVANGSPDKWCTYCRKNTHSDKECWCTRALPFASLPMPLPTKRDNYLLLLNPQLAEPLARPVAAWPTFE